MKGRSVRLPPCLAALIACGLLASAQLSASDDHYRVEMIVFSQSGQDSDNPERWPTRPEPALFERYAELDTSAGTPQDDIYRHLGGDAFQLSDIARRLDNSRGYRVISHDAWIQPGLDRSRSAAVNMPVGAAPPEATEPENGADDDTDAAPIAGPAALSALPPEGLSGWVRVSRERYLHLETDLRWVDPDGADERDMEGLDDSLADDHAPVVVMTESRRMRSNDLHYIDHPLLGILVRITQVDG